MKRYQFIFLFLILCLFALIFSCPINSGSSEAHVYYDFDDVTKWEAFDVSDDKVISPVHLPSAYGGAVFDGKYLYFSPSRESGAEFAGNVIFHGRVIRYNTYENFKNPSSWEVYDASSTGGLDTRGYAGGIFDGRYVYYCPWDTEITNHHAKVLRYDTQASFTSSLSWSVFNAGNMDASGDSRGYNGTIFDGKYVYFIPLYNDTIKHHGMILRYDTTNPAGFINSSSWNIYNASDIGGTNYSRGYSGAVFDGRYIYLVPSYNWYISGPFGESHGRVLRYDTKAVFTDPGSWSVYDAGNTGGMNMGRGYSGGVYDGRYIYFVPNMNSNVWHGNALRYDTSGIFTDSSSWEAIDVSSVDGITTKGFAGGIFDGRFIYFVPRNPNSNNLRHDTYGDFTNISSWESYDAGNTDGLLTRGYYCGAFDGQYVYFVPHIDPNNVYHTRVLRFKAKDCKSMPATISGGSFYSVF